MPSDRDARLTPADLRPAAFLVGISLCLVASEMSPWPGKSAWADGRMVFGAALPLALALLLTPRTHWLGLGLGSTRRGAVVLVAGTILTLGAMELLVLSDAVRIHYRSHSSQPLWLLLQYLPAVLQIELCFRGVLLFGLLHRLGPTVAVALSVLPYGLVHLDKPLPEALGSIPVGIALAGTALWTRSVWYGFVLHLIGAIALALLV